MAFARSVCLCFTVAIAAPAQAQPSSNVGITYNTPLIMSGAPAPQFQLRADPPDPRARIAAGYTSVNRGASQPVSVGHRYFYDETAHTYFGYDVVIQPEQQADTYRVTYYDLSIGPLDFAAGPPDSLDPTQWNKLQLPTLPAPNVVLTSDTISVDVFVNPDTGQKLVDSMTIHRMPQLMRFPTAPMQTIFISGSGTAAPARTAPTVSGPARDFSMDDAELSITQARVSVNGTSQSLAGSSRLASGTLVWFYLPKRGRYILSLVPRPDLGFLKAGELRGGVVTFTDGEDRIVLESPVRIGPGDAPYILYVLHDQAWQPTAQGQGNNLLLGSVSPRELAALKQ